MPSTAQSRASEHIPIGRPVAFFRLPDSGDMRLADFSDRLAALDLQPDLPISERPFVQVRLPTEGGLASTSRRRLLVRRPVTSRRACYHVRYSKRIAPRLNKTSTPHSEVSESRFRLRCRVFNRTDAGTRAEGMIKRGELGGVSIGYRVLEWGCRTRGADLSTQTTYAVPVLGASTVSRPFTGERPSGVFSLKGLLLNATGGNS
jgi:hypothetical protein